MRFAKNNLNVVLRALYRWADASDKNVRLPESQLQETQWQCRVFGWFVGHDGKLDPLQQFRQSLTAVS